MLQPTALPLSYRGIYFVYLFSQAAPLYSFSLYFQHAELCSRGILYISIPNPKIEKRTYADRAEYNKAAVAKRRRKVRLMAIEYGGGKCQICGYKKCNRALSFHHKDPNQKDFGLSTSSITRSWEKTKAELDKCILVCANCHMEIHEQIELKK